LINRVRLQQRPTGIIGEFDDLLQRGDWVTCLEHGRPIKKEKAMPTTRRIMLSAAIILNTAFAFATSAAFANAPGGARQQIVACQMCTGWLVVVAKDSPAAVAPIPGDGWNSARRSKQLTGVVSQLNR
jgi:hypothetical protein